MESSSSESLFEALLAEVQREPAEHQDHRDAARREEAVMGDRVRCGLAAVVGDEPDGDRPRDPAACVPEKEAPPRHPAEAGNPGGGEAKNGHEAPEEHGLAAVTFDE